MSGTISIQYKGTTACLDLSCPDCDNFTHYCVEMPFSGAVKCSGCNKVWLMSHDISIRRAGPERDDDWCIAYAVEGSHDE